MSKLNVDPSFMRVLAFAASIAEKWVEVGWKVIAQERLSVIKWVTPLAGVSSKLRSFGQSYAPLWRTSLIRDRS